MQSNRRDFLQSAPLALVGIPLVPMEKEGKHKYKLGQKFVSEFTTYPKQYKIIALVTEETKEGVNLSYRIKPEGNEYDFVMTEENICNGKFWSLIK